jgi:propionyl-CoA carboxylase alpha chain
MLTRLSTTRNLPLRRLLSTLPPIRPLEGAKVLIANRGEIACRVMRTAKRMGMKTVSVHSDVDYAAQHVKQSDETVGVGPAPSIESYLVIPNIVKAIKDTGATYVHPGYGFLSENAEFCTAVANMDVAFVGPGIRAISAMGDKIESKQIAIDAGINTIPGYQGVIKDADECVKVSNDIGYPVMIKASAGGGGKGMRIAWNDKEAIEGFRLSTDEAISSFDDDRIFIEKFIERPHHIEIQLLADGPEHNNVVCFPERECSIQRRNQKVIEEAPSVLLTEATRKEMARQSAQLARAVGYASAGTIEFLCDEKQNFYFLEMNTRLQVEHPVTEMITGVDLVQHMLEVASGQPLPKELVDAAANAPDNMVPRKGWAIEARIYAEDPFRGFLPSTGPLLRYSEPTTESVQVAVPGVTVRCDSGVVEGSEISMFYDPMISKLIAYADTREKAIEGLSAAVDDYVIRGVGHNTPFIASVCRNDSFKAGDTPTSFIETHYPEGFVGVELDGEETMSLAVSAAAISSSLRYALEKPPLPLSGATLYGEEHVVVTLGGQFGESFAVALTDEDAAIVTKIVDNELSGEPVTIPLGDVDCDPNNVISKVEVGGKTRSIQVLGETCEGVMTLQMHGKVVECVVRSMQEFSLARHMKEPPVVDTSKMLLSPMPGKLISYAVAAGDVVELGQELCVVEAMKMQNVMRSERKGVVKSIECTVGDSLKVDQVLLQFEDDSE